jgi:hypothetical protein
MTTIQITCPHCRTRCRLKGEAGKTPASRGKCPECGEVFPIPPGVRKNPEDTTDTSGSPKNRNLRIAAGLLALLLVGGGLWAASDYHQPEPPARTAAPARPAAKPGLDLDPGLKSELITRIKQHALVGDAGISLDRKRGRYRLYLLVSRNTPPTYAGELGRQFAYYLEQQLKKNSAPVPPIKVSVYYPGGTRLEVARNQHDGEEELLPYTTPAKPSEDIFPHK